MTDKNVDHEKGYVCAKEHPINEESYTGGSDGRLRVKEHENTWIQLMVERLRMLL